MMRWRPRSNIGPESFFCVEQWHVLEAGKKILEQKMRETSNDKLERYRAGGEAKIISR